MGSPSPMEPYKLPPSALDRPSAPGALWESWENEPSPTLLTYWQVLRKRRWSIAVIFLIAFTLVVLATLKQKPVYRARVLVEIQKENPDVATLQELFEMDAVSDTYLETQYKILASESLARRVIERLRLDRLPEFNAPASWWASLWQGPPEAAAEPKASVARSAEAVAALGRESVLRRFRDRLQVQPVKRSRLVEVSFESHDPALSAGVVNTLASNYIEQTLEARWDATQKATEWLGQQLHGLKAKLERSEDELQRYAAQNELLFLEGERGSTENIVNQRLRQLQDELTRAQAARYEKESLYRLIRAGDYGSLPGVFESNLMQDLTARQAELKRERAQLLTTFSADYPRVQQIQNQVDEVESVLERERDRAARRITKDYQAAVEREQLVQRAFVEQQKQANRVAERSVQYNILKREVETSRQLYEGLLQRLKEAGVSAGVKAANIRIVDSAQPPTRPVRPQVPLNLALGLLLSLGLGVGVALVQEHLDNTLKSTDDIERLFHLPTLGFIPVAGLPNGRGRVYGLAPSKRLPSGDEKIAGQTIPPAAWLRIDQGDLEHSALAEAFRGLRTSVLLSAAGHPPRLLLVSSVMPREGKTTVSINLAISLGQLGHRVLLLDGDMRRPSIHRAFGLGHSAGLVSYLAGHRPWREVVQPTRIAGLDALACGPIPPNPAELISSERMHALLREAASEYNFIVVDSPPLLNMADARILATLVDGAVLVVKAGSTPRDLIRHALSNGRSLATNWIGVVLNNVDHRADGYYGYAYEYYRSEDESRAKG